jgi:hypothetical protein
MAEQGRALSATRAGVLARGGDAMRLLLTLALIGLTALPAQAQIACVPAAMEYLRWGAAGEGIVAGDFVPAGEAWMIRAAGIATDDGRSLEWMMQIQHTLASGVCCWLVPLHRENGYAAGTPTLAITREVLLIAGERLAARVNSIAADKRMALIYVGWRYPDTCLPRLLGVETPIAGSGGGGGTPDLSALLAAATTAAGALTQLAASVP